MIQKVVNKHNLSDWSSVKDNLTYWLAKTREERVAALDYLRRQYHGSTVGLQRYARVIQRKTS